jgi:hypothetical protein
MSLTHEDFAEAMKSVGNTRLGWAVLLRAPEGVGAHGSAIAVCFPLARGAATAVYAFGDVPPEDLDRLREAMRLLKEKDDLAWWRKAAPVGFDWLAQVKAKRRDPRKLRAELEAAGLKCVSVSNATARVRDQLFAACLISLPARHDAEICYTPTGPVAGEAMRRAIKYLRGEIRGAYAIVAGQDGVSGVLVLHDVDGECVVKPLNRGSDALARQVLARLNSAALDQSAPGRSQRGGGNAAR